MATVTKKAQAPDKPASDSGPSDSGMSETLGGSKAGSGAHFGQPRGGGDHSNAAASRAESFKPALRDNSPGTMPEGTSKVIHGGANDKNSLPGAPADPRENPEV